MFVLVTYDVNTETVNGKKRLQKVAKTCVKYGQRVQNSVFECVLEPAQFIFFKQDLKGIIDENVDSLRFYKMGKNYKEQIEVLGKKIDFPQESTLIL